MIMVSTPTPDSNIHVFRLAAAQVIDAYVIRCVLDLGWHVSVRKDVTLHGISTPKSRSTRLGEKQAARMVRAVIEMWISKSPGTLLLRSHHPGNHAGRCIGDLVRAASNESLVAGLAKQELVKPYPGDVWTDAELKAITLKACALLNVNPDSVPS